MCSLASFCQSEPDIESDKEFSDREYHEHIVRLWSIRVRVSEYNTDIPSFPSFKIHLAIAETQPISSLLSLENDTYSYFTAD